MTNEMNTARPVGDEALREAARKALNYIENNESELGICLDCGDNLRAALASHPTTGQETVATPRDGGEWARDLVSASRKLLLAWEGAPELPKEVENALGAFEQAALPFFDDRAALSAPGSAGPGEPTDALVDRFADALKAKLRASEQKYGWRNGWLKPDWQADCQSDLARHVVKGDPLDVAAYAAFCWHHGWPTTTPSPAQEPGTGDTDYCGCPSMCISPECAGTLCPDHPTPATTAETRGPAEGAR